MNGMIWWRCGWGDNQRLRFCFYVICHLIGCLDSDVMGIQTTAFISLIPEWLMMTMNYNNADLLIDGDAYFIVE